MIFRDGRWWHKVDNNDEKGHTTMLLDDQELRDMAMFAGTAKMALDEIVRIRAQALSLTLTQIRQVRGVLITMCADAEALDRDLRAALATSAEKGTRP